MESDVSPEKPPYRLAATAAYAFEKIETGATIVLGVLLVATIFIGIGAACVALWGAAHHLDEIRPVIVTIDRLLFVLMVVEILHTVRDSFRSGSLVCEPFLVVGLIASIRRILSITLQSSQIGETGHLGPDAQAILHSTMIELVVLGGLILVMVVSICLLRYSKQQMARP
jgi:phosphate starvation-inducible membrane PsiE